jgi:hypothetical protein
MLWVWISFIARCTTLCDKVCQWLDACQWFSPDPPVSSTNKTDRHDITEILLKVALNTIKPTNQLNKMKSKKYHTVEIIPKSNIKIVERGEIDTTNTQIHDH